MFSQAIGTLLLALLTNFACDAQSSAAKLEFDVASVKASPDNNGLSNCEGGTVSNMPGIFRCHDFFLTNLVMLAFDLKPFEIAAPGWMLTQRADIDAKLSSDATPDQFRTMLQDLLIDRYKLAVHHESRNLSGYTMTVSKKGLKFGGSRETAEALPSKPGSNIVLGSDGYPVLSGSGAAARSGRWRVYYPKFTMRALAKLLSTRLNKPVSDNTGLNGEYEIALYWDAYPERRAATKSTADLPPGPSLEEAVEEQLGLRLDSKTIPADVVVVDHMDKTPGQN